MRTLPRTLLLLAGLAAHAHSQVDMTAAEAPLRPAPTATAARSVTRVVAAADASPLERLQADFACDGVDDQVEIQAAVQSLAGDGGRVVLSRGTFVLDSPGVSLGCVRLLDGVHLAGQGMGATVLKLHDFHGAAVTGIVRTPSGSINRDVSVTDLTIDGNRATNPATSGNVIGFFCGVSSGSHLSDVEIRVERVEVRNCNAYGFDPHERTTRLRLLDCLAHGNGLDGFTLDYCIDTVVVGCQAWNNDRHGFNLVTDAQGIDLVGCIARGNGSNGFTLQNGARDVLIRGGSACDNARDGVMLRASADVRIVGMLIRGNGDHGLRLRGTSSSHVLANRILDNSNNNPGAFNGLQVVDYLGAPSVRNVISGNIVTGGNHRYGIREDSSGQDHNTYMGNIATDATTANLSIAGSNPVVVANQNG